jgi:hypothetical protein
MKPKFVLEDGRLVWARFPTSNDIIRLTKVGALKLSIAKWKDIVDLKTAHPRTNFREGGRFTCACCRRYFSSFCSHCPIYEFTGQVSCRKTPYWDYEDKPTLKNATAELRFLEKVLKQIRKDMKESK